MFKEATVVFEDREELEGALNWYRYKGALEDVDNFCRGILKHGSASEETQEYLEKIRDMLRHGDL